MLLNNLLSKFVDFILKAYMVIVAFLTKIYSKIYVIWPASLHEKFRFKWVLLILLVVLIILFIIICCSIKKRKKRKVVFINGDKIEKVFKTKFRKTIEYPETPTKEGFKFAGWFMDKKFKKEYAFDVLKKKKNLYLYAKFVECTEEELAKTDNEEVSCEVQVSAVETPAPVVEPVVETPAPVVEPVQPKIETSASQYNGTIPPFIGDANRNEETLVEEIIEEPIIVNDIGDFYDSIRYEMLCYERATAFKQLGVTKKQIIAEMFEKDGKIFLYFAVDPKLMLEKGYNVEVFDEPEFNIVPCKKVIENKADFDEAIKLIKEAMLLNNFVKSDIMLAQKTTSDEATRKSGFAFYIKNDVVATTAADYYKLLRGVVHSYKLSGLKKYPENYNNLMILKIFKKGERVFIYLALNAEAENLEFVGYDKNFVDTPAMFEVKTADDYSKANSLIDKLMYRFGMEKFPEQAEISLEEAVDENCGFGYRIRR